jgi:hypothetical protein
LLGALNQSAANYNKVAQFAGTLANLDRVAGGSWTAEQLQFLAGVTSNIQTQLNAKANTADFSGVLEIRSFSVPIPSSEILTSNSTPITLVPAQGANTIIVPIKINGQLIYNSTPYATNGEFDIYCGGSIPCFAFGDDANFLFGTVSRIANATERVLAGATDTIYVANSPLTAQTSDGNPTAGNSQVVVSGLYYVITL